MYKGVIFDFNGTLFEDTDLQEEAWRLTIRKYFDHDMSPAEFQNRIYGLGNPDILTFLNSLDPGRQFDITITDEKEEIYRRICRKDPDRLTFIPGVEAMFDAMKADGLPMAIATASEITNVRFYYEFFHLERWFRPENVVYDDRTFPQKPAPDIYLKAAAGMKLDPSECLVCEDSLNGIRSAHSAGIGRIIARRSNPLIDSLPSELNVHAVIDDFHGFYPKYLED